MKFASWLFACVAVAQVQAKPSSEAVTYSGLSASAVAPSVTWHALRSKDIYSQDDYKNGFNATFYIIAAGRNISYATK